MGRGRGGPHRTPPPRLWGPGNSAPPTTSISLFKRSFWPKNGAWQPRLSKRVDWSLWGLRRRGGALEGPGRPREALTRRQARPTATALARGLPGLEWRPRATTRAGLAAFWRATESAPTVALPRPRPLSCPPPPLPLLNGDSAQANASASLAVGALRADPISGVLGPPLTPGSTSCQSRCPSRGGGGFVVTSSFERR